jgi:hypothetical protein
MRKQGTIKGIRKTVTKLVINSTNLKPRRGNIIIKKWQTPKENIQRGLC